MVTGKKGAVEAAEKKAAVKAAAPVVDKNVPEKKAEGKAETKAEPKKEVKAEEKKEVKAEAKKEVKTEVKKEAAPAAEKAVRTRKAPAKKDPAAKEVKCAMYVQFGGKEVTEKELLAAVKKAYVKLGNKAADIKKVEIYVKPEECAAYYVVNGIGSEDYKICL